MSFGHVRSAGAEDRYDSHMSFVRAQPLKSRCSLAITTAPQNSSPICYQTSYSAISLCSAPCAAPLSAASVNGGSARTETTENTTVLTDLSLIRIARCAKALFE